MTREATSVALNAVVDEYMQWWDAKQTAADVAESVSCPLYHYTNGAGLAGIIKSQEFWLTSIFQLNDTRELEFGVKLAIRELERQAQRGNGVLRFMIDRMKEVLAGKIREEFDFFVGSLSRRGNNLGQWGFYGDDGRGFALGIRPHCLEEMDCLVARVSYGRANSAARQREAIEKAVALVNSNMARVLADEQLGLEFLKKLSIQLAVSILWNSVTTKDVAYRPEAEIRLIVIRRTQNSSDVRTRRRGDADIRYFGLKVPLRDQKSFRRVVIGPDAQPGIENAIGGLLSSHGIDTHGLLYRSKIPYRSSRPAETVDQHFAVANSSAPKSRATKEVAPDRS